MLIVSRLPAFILIGALLFADTPKAQGRAGGGLSVPASNLRPMRASAPARRPLAPAWDSFRAGVHHRAAGLGVPPPGNARECHTCRGPARPGYTRCFQCEMHAQSAPGLLADAVVPVAYAAKGGELARDLWLYKSGCPGSTAAGARLLSLLLVFLHEHGRCVWQHAGMTFPTHVCVVPSGRGRAGPHPLQVLVSPFLTLAWAGLRPRPGGDPWARALDFERFRASQPLAGAAVLLLDDTWASGGSAQSAAVALKLAGARAVAAVVLGRHVAAGECPRTQARWADSCAVHAAERPAARARVNRLDG